LKRNFKKSFYHFKLKLKKPDNVFGDKPDNVFGDKPNLNMEIKPYM